MQHLEIKKKVSFSFLSLSLPRPRSGGLQVAASIRNYQTSFHLKNSSPPISDAHPPPPEISLNLAFVVGFSRKIKEKGSETPKFCKSAPPYRKYTEKGFSKFWGGVGVGLGWGGSNSAVNSSRRHALLGSKDATLLSMQIVTVWFLSRYFGKSMPSFWQKVVYTPPICITIRLPSVSRYFCRCIRVRGRWSTPNDSRESIRANRIALRIARATKFLPERFWKNSQRWMPNRSSGIHRWGLDLSSG